MNQYPLWKNLLILTVILVGLLLALPNVFPQDPSIEVTGTRDAAITDASVGEIRAAMENGGVPVKAVELGEDGKVLVRFTRPSEQLRGQEVIAQQLSDRYNYALTTSPDLPGWLVALGAKPMFLGLDLRGGIHVLIDVDMDAAVAQALERYTGDIRTELRNEKIRYLTVTRDDERIIVRFRDEAARDQAEKRIRREFGDLTVTTGEEGDELFVYGELPPAMQQQVQNFALQQNITTLRNRVNALGVAEPIIQRQGERRIVVQLPGAQDPARLKEL
ncbi:MAG: protein translocase subunit SecD, partial [Thiohalocapsa sp.]